MCGISFKKRISHLGNSVHGIYFCSRKCKDAGQTIDGGVKEIQPPHYGTASGDHRYREKNYGILISGCVDCGEKKMWMLHIHHIDGNRRNSKPPNLEVVCSNHHLKRHLVLVDGEWVVNFKHLTPRYVLSTL